MGRGMKICGDVLDRGVDGRGVRVSVSWSSPCRFDVGLRYVGDGGVVAPPHR